MEIDDALHRGSLWVVLPDKVSNFLVNGDEAAGRGDFIGILDHAIGEGAEVAAFDRDDAVAGAAQGGVEAEDDRHGGKLEGRTET